MTTSSCVFVFDRPSNGILSIYRADAVFTVTAAGTGAEAEVGGASTTGKDGVGDGRIDRSRSDCWTGVGGSKEVLLNGLLELGV